MYNYKYKYKKIIKLHENNKINQNINLYNKNIIVQLENKCYLIYQIVTKHSRYYISKIIF